MAGNNIGALLIEHCSPTLAGIKVANMFSVNNKSQDETIKELRSFERMLSVKGIRIQILGLSLGRFLVYVYREDKLAGLLSVESIQEFLRGYGYSSFKANDVLSYFDSRLGSSKCFPHEIGILLGYPLEDVKGFIREKGQNSICSGCWKAYVDEEGARANFIRIDECRCKYKRLYEEGASIYDLTAWAV